MTSALRVCRPVKPQIVGDLRRPITGRKFASRWLDILFADLALITSGWYQSGLAVVGLPGSRSLSSPTTCARLWHAIHPPGGPPNDPLPPSRPLQSVMALQVQVALSEILSCNALMCCAMQRATLPGKSVLRGSRFHLDQFFFVSNWLLRDVRAGREPILSSRQAIPQLPLCGLEGGPAPPSRQNC